MAKKINVAVLFGGRSVEHEISVISALQMISAIDPTAYHVVPVYIAPSGVWYTGNALLDRKFYAKGASSLALLTEVTLLPKPGTGGLTILSKKDSISDRLLKPDQGIIPVDVYLPAFHGQFGEDGCIQGLFELADVPYAGSNVVASAVTMNKYICKVYLKAHEIPVLPALLISRDEAKRSIEEITSWVNTQSGFSEYPLFVKPCNLGSSIGVSRVASKEELAPALAKVFRYDVVALVEPCVSNIMEINVSVREHDGVIASVVEIPISQSGVLSYEEKYLRDGGKKTGPSQGMASLTRIIDPPDLDPVMKKQVIDYATLAFDILGCSGVARLDFIVDLSSGQLYFNELNSFPGSCSFYLWMRSQPRVLYTQLAAEMIETALKTKATQICLDRDIGLKALAGT
jgi:D-alanine-D-alanine ligase